MVEDKKTAVAKPAVAKPYDVVDAVSKTLRKFTGHGELVLPSDYSIENSLKSAWLMLQETFDKEKRPVLQVCSTASIANALLDMAVQGLNPGKKQCYFIAFGTKLLCLRSYFGAMVVAKRVGGAKDIWAEVVYVGDVFEYEITHNRKSITKHSQKLENVGGSIIAAYCVVEFADEKATYTEIMTIDQIHKAWDKSKMKPSAPDSTHSLYPDEMCKRTVINRACKKLINSSTDSALFLEHFNRSDDDQAEDEVTEEIESHANQVLIDVAEEEEKTDVVVVEEKGVVEQEKKGQEAGAKIPGF